jgi:SAM-dependent methyltransferase
MPRYKPFDWYENALYYDIVFDTDTEDEADFLEAVWDRHVLSRGRRVLEPACGSGRLVAEMATRGFSVTGIDISDGMLRYARQRLDAYRLSARVVNTPMQDFSFNGTKFDFAHCLVSSFKHLTDEEHARAHLQCVADALKPGGVYVLALHLTDYEDDRIGRERWVGRRDGVEVVCNIQGWPANRRTRLERIRSRFKVTENGGTAYYETHWNFFTYSLRQIRRLLAMVPDLDHVATYDYSHDIEHRIPFDGEQYDNILILRKRI